VSGTAPSSNAQESRVIFLQASHQPRGNAAVGFVLPDEIGMAVGVEIAAANELPVRIGDLRCRKAQSHELRAVHEPGGDSAVGPVVPQKVEEPIAVEIDDGIPLPCDTSKLWSATRIVALRERAVKFAATEKSTTVNPNPPVG
jgi:hypothetical protein